MEAPTISVAQWETIARCERRLHIWLSPERPSAQPAEEKFRLKQAVVDAIKAAHTRANDLGVDITEAVDIDNKPPDHLEPEEQARFSEAVEAYAEAISGRPGVLRIDDEIPPRPSRSGLFQLSGKPDLVFDLPDAAIEVRRVLVAPRRPGTRRLADTPFPAAMRLLLRPPGDLTVLQLHLVSPGGTEEVRVSDDSARALALEINETVQSAAASRMPAAVPGWWCNGCPSIASCPAVPQQSPQSVLASW